MKLLIDIIKVIKNILKKTPNLVNRDFNETKQNIPDH